MATKDHNVSLVTNSMLFSHQQLDKDDNVKLADVGLTKLERDISGVRGRSSCYAAPEVLEGLAYEKAADVYSLGIITWELWYGRLVQDELSTAYKGDVEKAIREGIRPSMSIIHEPPDELKELIGTMWSRDPKSRPQTSAVLDGVTAIRW